MGQKWIIRIGPGQTSGDRSEQIVVSKPLMHTDSHMITASIHFSACMRVLGTSSAYGYGCFSAGAL